MSSCLELTTILADCGKYEPETDALLPCEFCPVPMLDPVYLPWQTVGRTAESEGE